MNNDINPITTGSLLRNDPVARLNQPACDIVFEGALGGRPGLVDRCFQRIRVFRIFDEPPPQIARLWIDSLLRRHMEAEKFEKVHRILCGNAAQFQGDERDVVFLSVVDSSDGGVLPLRQTDEFKRRFNVAASRARDQMWVVHSLDPRAHLRSAKSE